jgi:hypothetical protein
VDRIQRFRKSSRTRHGRRPVDNVRTQRKKVANKQHVRKRCRETRT